MRLQCAVLCVMLLSIEQIQARTKKVHLSGEDMLLFWRRSNAVKCKPFTVFKIDCNQCVCAADGTTSCTKMDCGIRRDNENSHKTTKMRKLPKRAKDEDSEDTDEKS